MPHLTGTSPADGHNSSIKRTTMKSRENPKYIRSDSSATIIDCLTSEVLVPYFLPVWGQRGFYLPLKQAGHMQQSLFRPWAEGMGCCGYYFLISFLLHPPTGWVWWLPSEGKYGPGSPVTRAGVGSYYLIMTTTHIQGTALGNTHTPSARAQDLAVGVQEQSLMSINFIPGDHKCRSPSQHCWGRHPGEEHSSMI